MMAMPRDYVRLDDEQFAKLVELLTPGYELAKAYLAANRPPEPDRDPDGNAPSGEYPDGAETQASEA